jgi:hypothetical protein
VSEKPQRVYTAEELRELSEQAMSEFWRNRAERANRPSLEMTREQAERFSGAIGLDKNGNLQRPLTDEEREHNEEVRRRARGN